MATVLDWQVSSSHNQSSNFFGFLFLIVNRRAAMLQTTLDTWAFQCFAITSRSKFFARSNCQNLKFALFSRGVFSKDVDGGMASLPTTLEDLANKLFWCFFLFNYFSHLLALTGALFKILSISQYMPFLVTDGNFWQLLLLLLLTKLSDQITWVSWVSCVSLWSFGSIGFPVHHGSFWVFWVLSVYRSNFFHGFMGSSNGWPPCDTPRSPLRFKTANQKTILGWM